MTDENDPGFEEYEPPPDDEYHDYEEEEFTTAPAVLTPRGIHQLSKAMVYFKDGVDMEDISQILDLAGKEHIQILMHLADYNGILDIIEDYGHSLWGTDGDETSNLFDRYADKVNSDHQHREYHAAASALGFFTNVPGILPDDATRVWLEALYDEMLDNEMSEVEANFQDGL